MPKGPQEAGSIHDFQYIYNIGTDHPPGTYFYHAHYHGAVASQVASGMAGCLIIEGAVDDIPEIRAAAERVLMVQSQCVGPDGTCESDALLNLPGPTYVNAQLMPELSMVPGNRADLRVKAPRRPGRYTVDGGGTIGPIATVVVEDAPARDQPLFSGALPSYRHLAPISDAEGPWDGGWSSA